MSENIFKFWRAVEALTPQEADPISKNAGAGSERVLEIGTGKGKDFPWRVPERLRRPPAGKAWRYTLQTVVFDANELMDRVEEELVKGRPVSGPVGSDRPAAGGEGVHCAEETEADFDDMAKNKRRARMSRLFDLEFDQDGLPVVSSFALSLCGWAAGVILKHGLAALDHPATCAVETSRRLSTQRGSSARPQTGFPGFHTLCQDLEDELDERAAALRDENGNIVKTVDLSWLEDFAAFVVGKCGLTQEELFQGPWEHRLKCVQVKAKEVKNGNGGKEDPGEEQRDDSLMNSFFTADLSELAAAEPATLGAGLQAFMAAAPPAAGERKDIRTDDGRSHTATLLLPARHPAGRWPADHPLVYSQQTAVNALWEKLQDRPGIMAVNGPPGTGKTTLLRDIVAAVVVERARELSKLPRPKDAFAVRKMETPEGNTIYFHPFRDTVSSKLEDFTIVVASSNNKAVENVSLELPRQSAVGTRWRQEAEGVDYFRALATALGRGRDGGETAVDERGNDNLMGPVRTGGDSGAGNEDDQENAWALIAARLGRKSHRQNFIKGFWSFKTKSAAPGGGLHMDDHLDAIINKAKEPAMSWSEARKAFREALDNEKKVREKLVAASGRIAEVAECVQKQDAIRERRARRQKELGDKEAKEKTLCGEKRQADAALTAALKARNDHWLHDAGRWKRLWNWFAVVLRGKLRAEKKEYEGRVAEVDKGEKEQKRLAGALQKVQAEMKDLREKLKKLIIEEEEQRSKEERLRRALAEERAWIGDKWPQSKEDDDADREKSSPWAVAEWYEARTRVFLAALALHRAFVEGCPEQMRRNLGLAMDWLKGVNLSDSLRLLAFQSLCLVVPVLSTTFAALPRFLAGIEKEQIGWLLIDEAGQAVPQAAAGAVWRAKRTVVVGDPRQLEPIVVIPGKMEAALARYYGVEDAWRPSLTSAQVLADQATELGTFLEGQGPDDRIWVGAPLRVHRRCDDPMFTISNAIAYNGLMFHDKVVGGGKFPPSRWVNVTSDKADGHWVVEERRAVIKLLQEMREGGSLRGDNVFLISPFRDVSGRLREIGKRFGFARPEEQIGTIHTAQGKEADIVILVLGGDPKKVGDKQWAAAKPNLLNVAVSRAKKCLLVVGNRNHWMRHSYFDVAAEKLAVEDFTAAD